MIPSLLAGLTLVIGAPGAKERSSKDVASVEGVWVVEKGVVSGNEDAIRAGSVTFEFAEGKVRVREGSKQPDPADYTVDQTKTPAEIDITPPPSVKDLTMCGIYKVDGDALTLCLNRAGKRPSTFESPSGSDVLLLTLKRAKVKD
jgi:uncharacterized protein (TIGR03067 family)